MRVNIDLPYSLGKSGPFIWCRFPSATETQHARGFGGLQAHRTKNVRWLLLARRTGRASRDCETQFVQLHYPASLCCNIGHQSRDSIPQPLFGFADDNCSWRSFQQTILKILAPTHTRLRLARVHCFLASLQHGDERKCASNILGSGAPALLLRPAEDQRLDMALARALQEPNATGSTEFMGAAAYEIAIAQALRRNFSQPLDRIAKERNFVLLADGQGFAPRLQHAGDIVGGH